MIFGDLAHYEQEKHLYPRHVQKGLDAILSSGIVEKTVGKYEIDGELMFALVQEVETEPVPERLPESHIKYADIQLLVGGQEAIGVAKYSAELPVKENNFETRDIAFYDRVNDESTLVLRPGQFAVFYPSDVHRPCCQVSGPSAIKKVVVKIHKQLWND